MKPYFQTGFSRRLAVLGATWPCVFFGSNSDLSYTRGWSRVWEQLELNQCCNSACHVCLFLFFIFVCSFETGSDCVILAVSMQTRQALTSGSVSPSASRMLRLQEWITQFSFNDKGDMGSYQVTRADLNSCTKLSFCLSLLSTRCLGVPSSWFWF